MLCLFVSNLKLFPHFKPLAGLLPFDKRTTNLFKNLKFPLWSNQMIATFVDKGVQMKPYQDKTQAQSKERNISFTKG
jgi:hypothetical protein